MENTWNDAIILFALRSAYANNEYKSREQNSLAKISTWAQII